MLNLHSLWRKEYHKYKVWLPHKHQKRRVGPLLAYLLYDLTLDFFSRWSRLNLISVPMSESKMKGKTLVFCPVALLFSCCCFFLAVFFVFVALIVVRIQVALCLHLPHSLRADCLVGLVVTASAWRAKDPGFESCLPLWSLCGDWQINASPYDFKTWVAWIMPVCIDWSPVCSKQACSVLRKVSVGLACKLTACWKVRCCLPFWCALCLYLYRGFRCGPLS